jgi:quinol-cytochrome oxidoreductase complex cytochrome b subunit
MRADALKRARGSLFGTRSRAAAYLTRAARQRVSPDYRGLRMISAAILLLFSMQMVTGVLLSLYYYPEPEAAYESARFLTGRVTAGWLLRSVHHWTAELFVVGVVVHLAVAFFRRGYDRRREYLWITGVFLLVLALGSRFTGRLLPWDTIGLEATRLGLDMLSAVPIVGKVTATWLRGGEQFGPNTLSRFFTTHVLILPWLTVIAGLLHVYLVRRREPEGGAE